MDYAQSVDCFSIFLTGPLITHFRSARSHVGDWLKVSKSTAVRWFRGIFHLKPDVLRIFSISGGQTGVMAIDQLMVPPSNLHTTALWHSIMYTAKLTTLHHSLDRFGLSSVKPARSVQRQHMPSLSSLGWKGHLTYHEPDTQACL